MMDRRDFLRTAGMAAASGTLAAAGLAADDKIRVALYGTNHAHTSGKLRAMLASPHLEVAGYCEPDAELREELKQDRQFQRVRMLSEEELLGDSSIQLVVVECFVW